MNWLSYGGQQHTVLYVLVQVRHLRKKLQQIEALEARAAEGDALDAQQAAKVAQRPQVCWCLTVWQFVFCPFIGRLPSQGE